MSIMMENSKNVEESFKKRIENVENELLEHPEDYDDIEEDDHLQGKVYRSLNIIILRSLSTITDKY